MKDNDYYQVLRAALIKWGVTSQMRMLQEECAELIVAVNRHERNQSANTLHALKEECADVEIMLDQARYVLSDWQPYVREKLDRLKGRLGDT